jgi:hypothetical protein
MGEELHTLFGQIEGQQLGGSRLSQKKRTHGNQLVACWYLGMCSVWNETRDIGMRGPIE